jgi:hypothetical protein
MARSEGPDGHGKHGVTGLPEVPDGAVVTTKRASE